MADGATPLMIPSTSVAVTEGTLLEWLAADGDEVREGQPIYRLETDKVEIEVESPGAGRIRLAAEAGRTYPVGQIVGYLE